ncbi:MAG: chemotaxis-specific protein-glutamate methyltransferase CheB [Candidatus Heimdallarchaeota archaeon]|nr:chemotaxis-specific protein-glutamate methyltransferase CheB [Candidatus Heimdallarchaeota archaeon]MCK5048607.1 chemotaxis-specific protein-glutamate methyltransferase CheB [Candidatus Heimdallarchaeota archaeon]
MSAKKSKIRIFIIDDSAVARLTITQIIEKEGAPLEVIGSAPNGFVACQKLDLPKYEADVIITDIVMPEMDGIETIKNIMSKQPTPIIAISALRTEKEITTALSKLGIDLLDSGAVIFVKKPESKNIADQARFERQLLRNIYSQFSVDLIKSFTTLGVPVITEDEPVVEEKIIIRDDSNANRIIVIGASTGGPKAINYLLTNFPPISPPILIVQHMPKEMTKVWAERLQRMNSKLKISLAKNNTKLKQNNIYVAPGGFHCIITKGKQISLVRGKKVNFVIPAIDVTFNSVAGVYGKNVLGLILTGMGRDGLEGAKTIKSRGGIIFAEHESTSIISSMPNAVINAKKADKVVPLHKMPSMLRLSKWI